MKNGTVTLSFDCEGKWGMADISTGWDVSLTRNNLLKAYEFMLKTLQEYNISATFAFVGAFTESREMFIEEVLPLLTSKNYSSWLNNSIERIIDKEDEGWFMPELLSLVKEYDIHEIATHGYTHIPFNMLDIDDVKIELGLIESWAKKHNIECQSLVYPRNIIEHQDLLSKFGIFGYRDIPNIFANFLVPKLFKTLLEEVLIFKEAQNIEVSKPAKIPGGVFVNWQFSFRKYIPELISMLKYKSMIRDAKLKCRVAHFWLHPHNLITSPSTKNLFKKLCEEIAVQRDEMSLDVKRQNDYFVGNIHK